MRLKAERNVITCPACRKTEKIDKKKKRKFLQEVEVPVLEEKKNFYQIGPDWSSHGYLYEMMFCEDCGNVFLLKIKKL